MDIDLDLPTNFDPNSHFDVVQASMLKNGELVKHPCGVYFQNISKDKITQLAAIPYEEAEKLGYFKIDFLHLSLLDYFKNKNEIRTLLKTDPDWSLLEKREVVEQLFQLHKHFDIISQIKPRSIQELADCIALIRPGKRYLLPIYIKNREFARKELYMKPKESVIWFKKSHSIAYAMTIVLQLHLFKGGIL
ncbi:MAG: hypothetical protein QXL17_02650 [Candidatus Thermoplasmatota archaeon]